MVQFSVPSAPSVVTHQQASPRAHSVVVIGVICGSTSAKASLRALPSASSASSADHHPVCEPSSAFPLRPPRPLRFDPPKRACERMHLRHLCHLRSPQRSEPASAGTLRPPQRLCVSPTAPAFDPFNTPTCTDGAKTLFIPPTFTHNTGRPRPLLSLMHTDYALLIAKLDAFIRRFYKDRLKSRRALQRGPARRLLPGGVAGRSLRPLRQQGRAPSCSGPTSPPPPWCWAVWWCCRWSSSSDWVRSSAITKRRTSSAPTSPKI